MFQNQKDQYIFQEKDDNENNSTKYWTKEKIGVYGWTVLHLIAARLPSKLTKDEQSKFKVFMHLFAKFYPCDQCSEHFQQLLVKNPINVTSRQDGIQYMCKVHNIVNKRTKKKQFQCDTDQIFEKWGGKESCICDKDNDCRCDIDDDTANLFKNSDLINDLEKNQIQTNQPLEYEQQNRQNDRILNQNLQTNYNKSD